MTTGVGLYPRSALDLNASTFTARVVASTQADLFAAVTAGYCALTGPLHGGAPEPVLEMLDAIGSRARI
ncbi:citrate/2-methylcitrate synthase, partial [Pseudomonas hunanensis]|uniref:citrate/2-methylcitrate synthase n=1 Tax=Pseudomonas hunanensis TaxID=1247546 RepID=UPI0030D83982